MFKAAGVGALLFQEAGNRVVAALFTPDQEYAEYSENNLESLVEHFLTHHNER